MKLMSKSELMVSIFGALVKIPGRCPCVSPGGPAREAVVPARTPSAPICLILLGTAVWALQALGKEPTMPQGHGDPAPASSPQSERSRPGTRGQTSLTRTESDGKSAPSNRGMTEGDRAAVVVASDEEYRISRTDVIEVQVEHAPELSGMFRVNSSGAVLVPHIGRVTALDKTTEELANAIADQLRGRYLKNPQVAVNVVQYNSHAFFVQGSVRIPGLYHIEGRPSLLKLITIAGGLTETHGSSAFVIREIRGRTSPADAAPSTEGDRDPRAGAPSIEPKYEMTKYNIAGLLKGSFDQNAIIEPGDVVNIPATDIFFVAGEVRAPGQFPLKDGTTLRQAISLAQGTTFKAALGRGLIFREDPVTGTRKEIVVNIGAVMKGAKEDVPVMANDVIIVPNSRFKVVSGVLLDAYGLYAVRYPLRY
jgi:polysaccharide export outer membrane protein